MCHNAFHVLENVKTVENKQHSLHESRDSGPGVGMHPTVLDFAERTLTSEYVTGKHVLEVGSYDVNGSVRPTVEALQPAEYLGVDQSSGPRVDRVVNCENLVTGVGCAVWDLVITTEMLEHVRDWRSCMTQLVSVVAPGGYLFLTTRSPGFPYHAFPEDHWRFTHNQMWQILTMLGLVVLALEDDPEPGVLVFAQRPKSAPHIAPGVLFGIEVDKPVR